MTQPLEENRGSVKLSTNTVGNKLIRRYILGEEVLESNKNRSPEPIGFCDCCGQALFSPEVGEYYKKEHVCEPPEEMFEPSKVSSLTRHLLAALINAESALAGTHEEPDRAIARARRALWLFKLDDDDVFFYKLRTSAELPRAEF